MIAKTILGYTVDEEIGSGASGTVYKVSKTNASGTYIRALKHITIPSQKAYADKLDSMGGDYAKTDDYFAGILREIVREIQIISSLSESGTRNIVKYYENDITESESPKRYDIFILMECLTPFSEYMHQKELKVRDVIKLGKDILTALISCHEQNVIHRDIKEDNIFVSADGSYKLGDFGASKVLSERSKAESMKGTPNYIAPEIHLHKEQYDETVDLYSLGIVLYKLLNKSRNPFLPAFPEPYNSTDEDIAFERRMKGEIPALPCDAVNTLGEAILPAVKPREKRYGSANAFLTALTQAEQSMTEDELNIVVNTVFPQFQESMDSLKSSRAMAKTIGTDLENAAMESGCDKEDRDLFTTFSDTFNKEPLVTDPVVKMEDPRIDTPQPSPQPSSQSPVPPQQSFGRGFVPQMDNQQPVRVEAVKGSDFRWVAFLLPIVIFVIYMILYLAILPNVYGKGVSIGQWLFSSPEEVLEVLQDQNAVFTGVYTIWAVKFVMYLLWIFFIASLVNLSRVLHNTRPEYNVNAVMRDQEPYLKATEIYEVLKNSSCKDASRAKTAVRNITERLKNECAFGIGNDTVIACEMDIARCLKEIEGNIQALFDDKTAGQAGDVVVSNCNTIQAKLRIRTELKKK